MPGERAPADVSGRIQLLHSALDQLACPACFGRLRLHASELLCAMCGRHYPILDGIPVLIMDKPNQELP